MHIASIASRRIANLDGEVKAFPLPVRLHPQLLPPGLLLQ